jgi:cytochrome c-type biogenesis protein CcmH
MMLRSPFLALLLVCAAPAAAQEGGVDPALANEQLADPVLEARATELMETLRCIQCQSQSIADSDAPIAAAMRSEVRQRIKAGESPDAIRQWMISRYGEWVSFNPPMNAGTLLLWFAPFLMLIAGIWMVRGLFRKEQT